MKTVSQSETRTIPAGEFKAKCLKLMDEVAQTQEPITVTKHGKAVGQFVPMPAESKQFRSIFGRSPDFKVPDYEEWKKFKAESAQEWEDSFERRARILEQTSREQPKSRRK